jgi:hypothetical protein
MALQHRDHRALRLAHDALDQLQRMRGTRAETNERYIEMGAGGEVAAARPQPRSLRLSTSGIDSLRRGAR